MENSGMAELKENTMKIIMASRTSDKSVTETHKIILKHLKRKHPAVRYSNLVIIEELFERYPELIFLVDTRDPRLVFKNDAGDYFQHLLATCQYAEAGCWLLFRHAWPDEKIQRALRGGIT